MGCGLRRCAARRTDRFPIQHRSLAFRTDHASHPSHALSSRKAVGLLLPGLFLSMAAMRAVSGPAGWWRRGAQGRQKASPEILLGGSGRAHSEKSAERCTCVHPAPNVRNGKWTRFPRSVGFAGANRLSASSIPRHAPRIGSARPIVAETRCRDKSKSASCPVRRLRRAPLRLKTVASSVSFARFRLSSGTDHSASNTGIHASPPLPDKLSRIFPFASPSTPHHRRAAHPTHTPQAYAVIYPPPMLPPAWLMASGTANWEKTTIARLHSPWSANQR